MPVATTMKRRLGGLTGAAVVLATTMLGRQALGQVDTYFSEADMKRFEGIAQAGMQSKLPEDVYYSTKLAKALGTKTNTVCNHAKQLVTSAKAGNIEAVGYGLGALLEGGCDVALGDAQAKVAATLKSGWASEGFTHKFLTLLGDAALGGGKILENVDAAVKNLNKHRSEEGFVRESLEEKAGGSTDGTFSVLELLAATKVTSKGIKKTLEKAQQLLPGNVYASSDVGADATLLSALVKALAALDEPALSIEAAQGEVLAAKLLKMKGTPSPKGAYKVLTGLQTLTTHFAEAVPVAVVLTTPVVTPSEPFKVEVKGILMGNGGAASSEVVLEQVNAAALQEEITAYAGKTLKSLSGGSFQGPTDELEPGVYELVLRVGDKSDIKRSLIVKAPADLKNVEVGISPSRTPLDGKLYSVSATKQLTAGLKATATEGEYISTTFTVDFPAPPQQAFLKFTHLPSGTESLYAAKRQAGTKATGWQFLATVSLPEETTAFQYKSGEYQLSLLVGDVSMTTPLEMNLGTLTLTFPATPKVHHPLYKRPLLWESDNALEPLPEIIHQFRLPEKRPNPVLPAFFSLLIVLTFCVFVMYLPRVGANLEGVPGGAGFVWSMAWVGCLVGVCVLFSAYWFWLKGMTTLKYLFFLGLGTVFVGHRAFSWKHKGESG